MKYSFSNSLFTYKLCDISEIKSIYDDIVVEKNEDNEEELSFKNKEIAEKFTRYTSKLSLIYMEDRTRYSMQLLADIIKRLNEEGLISISDLYCKKESEIIDIIKKSKYKNYFLEWVNAKKLNISKEKPKNVYYINFKTKIRYINPLVNKKRIYDISKETKEMIEKNLSYDMTNYVYLNFDL